MVAGYSLTASNRDLALVRYTSSGTPDPTFSGDGVLVLGVGTGDDEAAALVIQPDGKIVVVGYAADGSQHDMLIARFLDDGTPDPSFNGTGRRRVSFGAGNAFGTAVALQADGKILAAGYARVGTVFHFAVARVDENGLLDPMLDGDGLLTTTIGSTSQANAIASDATGRFVVAGFARIAGNDDMALVRYDGAGALDSTSAAAWSRCRSAPDRMRQRPWRCRPTARSCSPAPRAAATTTRSRSRAGCSTTAATASWTSARPAMAAR